MLKYFRHMTDARRAFIVLSTLMFFFSAQVSLTIYVDSSFLASTVASTPGLAETSLWKTPENMVGVLYTFASLITILFLLWAPKILSRCGNYRATLTILITHFLLLLGLALFDTAWLIIPMFIVESALISLLYFNFDIFLERYSRDQDTGLIRGFFLAIGSLAWMIPPTFAGKIVETSGYAKVYFVGAIIVIPMIFLIERYLGDFKDLTYDTGNLAMSRKEVHENPNIWSILATNFFLHFFYAWMVIYGPIYMVEHVGFSWESFGMILTIALSAFVVFPAAAGWIADRWLGEKELLVLGFLLMAAGAAALPFLPQATAAGAFGVWAVALFIGRSGAATVEAMNEAYFFKQIDGRNATLIGYFRRSRPMAWISAPLIASALLEFDIVTIRELFFILAILMCYALRYAFAIKDTR